ncbi:MAG TPA: xanthine dehydrogenase family protein subunit M [Alphaproteobacteria bacterium]|nr:xanthine dehydrogenase family protein subunit M [Alphaproteobacteria bacterium]
MKAPRFAYRRAATLAEALDMLAGEGPGAVPLAGGQSLLATLNMRLSTPTLLVDIGDLDELVGIALERDVVRIGAMTRHAHVLESAVIRQHAPLVAEAIGHVGHVAIRNRGTFGGSLAYADPAAELPACTVALAGTVVVASRAGRREVPAERFFKGLFETDLAPGELIVEIRLPAHKPDRTWAFLEFARRHGDFAIVGLAAQATLADARIVDARLVYLGCVDRPKLARAAARALAGRTLPLDETAWIEPALAEDLDPPETPGCSAATKRQLAAVLTRRAVAAWHDRMPR